MFFEPGLAVPYKGNAVSGKAPIAASASSASTTVSSSAERPQGDDEKSW
jgi:hypothetical protein